MSALRYLGLIPFLIFGVALLPVALLLMVPFFLLLGLFSLIDWVRR
jgi:hypothetical protein